MAKIKVACFFLGHCVVHRWQFGLAVISYQRFAVCQPCQVQLVLRRITICVHHGL